MADGDVGEQCKAMSARLAHGIRGSALSLHLHLRVVLIGWLSQLKKRERKALLQKFRIGKIRRVRGILIRGCLDTRTTTNRYNRAWMKVVKPKLCAWFSAIASCRIHVESRLAILKA